VVHPCGLFGTLFIFLGDGRPRLVRIEPLHLLKLIESLGSEVFVVDNTIMANNEGDRDIP
jgi:hypothetical protein